MQVKYRYAALGAGFAVEFLAAMLLLVQVTGSNEVEVSEKELASARAVYKRNQAARTPRRPQVTPRPDPSPPVRKQPEPEPEERPARREPERRAPQLSSREAPEQDVPKLDDVRESYDHGAYVDALKKAEAFLEEKPGNSYVQRVAVSSACAVGSEETAQTYYSRMNDPDKKASRVRCKRYGITFDD